MLEPANPGELFNHLPRPIDRKATPALNHEQAIRGADAAILSARALLEDAKLMFQHERWSRAASLGVLAMEEFGKFHMLIKIASAESENERKAAWKDFYSHSAKAGRNIVPGGHKEMSPSDLDQWRVSAGRRFDALKQLGFYSTMTLDGTWTRPVQSVSRQDAVVVIKMADYNIGQLANWDSSVWERLPRDRR